MPSPVVSHASEEEHASRPSTELEQLVRTLFDGSVAMAISDAQGRLLRVNDSLLLMTGHDPEDLVGQSGVDIGLFADAGAIARCLRGVRRGRQVRDTEVSIRCKDGEIRHALASIDPLEIAGETKAMWLFVDITARKRAEAKQLEYERELKASNALLRGLTSAQAAFIGEGESRRVFDDLLASLVAATGSQFGFIGEVLATEDGEPFLRTYAMTDVALTEEHEALYHKHQRDGLEYHDVHTLYGPVMADGVPVIVDDATRQDRSLGGLPPGHPTLHTFAGLPVLGAGRSPVGVIGLANRPGGYSESLLESLRPFVAGCGTLIQAQQALRRQRQSEQALRESEERFRLLVDGARDYALLMLDPFGRVTNWNAGAEQITGYDARAAADLHFSRFYTPEAIALGAPEAELDAAAQHGRCAAEGWRVRADGRRFFASVVLTALRDADDVLRGYAQLTRDITQRQQLERMKNEFVSTVSHELRTPLTAIRGAMSLLQGGVMGQLPAGALELVGMARSNCERLVRLINDILDIEKIEAGKMELRLVWIDPERMVARTLADLGAMAQEAKVELAHEIAAPGKWRVDEDRVIQVLTNLVSNAIKFSPPGGKVVVRVSAGATPGHLRAGVTDSGPGISADKRPLLFGKFQQLDSSDSRKKGGTGLGLAICKAIAEQHGGSIGVETAPGVGSTFWFELPCGEGGS
jgi:PAS domain S-box-containing protein